MGYWRCKKCGCNNVKSNKVFAKDSVVMTTQLECMHCDNQVIGNLKLTNYFDWVEEKEEENG